MPVRFRPRAPTLSVLGDRFAVIRQLADGKCVSLIEMFGKKQNGLKTVFCFDPSQYPTLNYYISLAIIKYRINKQKILWKLQK
ncbi:hypothetical protein COS55_03170 [Candidatus Shapirobacteria bacterium CG03_land_8_20_14_0_80_40_19]|uniref:Uncharacterized protein n=2 Tax=Candidatus Shapironibacteriota TaxID=1752721 RepID=A0A2M7BC52_9BACT|nr:MAG: hypothetical protein COS55_03170 [Candidatus Shapirobacteria bacterium CG03_land_8_20_14_0_80_40_19]PJC29247.1 MAG: hypothetical protein CO053_00290 [Candidatus Shapirobacteria bacterium CG_4_9_14_0_2_um_filter_40_11]